MIKIVVDSTGYIDEGFIKENNIEIVPLRISIGGKEYKEIFELSASEFYKLLAETTVLPKTSQPSVQDFINVYKPIIESGDSIISIHISEKVSGTINSARMAINELHTDKVRIVDSKSTTFSIKFLTEHAVKLVREGFDFENVYKSTEELVKRLYNRFIFEDIKYLVEGGRLNRAEGLIGSLLNVKPILSFTDGVVKPEGISRTWRRAKESLIKFAEGVKNTVGIEKLCVIYGENVEEGKEFAATIKNALQLEVDMLQCGAVIGTYAGPCWLAVGMQALQ